MKYFIIFLVLASFAVIMPQSFGECISLPCDDANIKLDEPNYRFVDFSYANTFEDSIKFILERTAYGHCISFNAEIIDEDGNLVWGEGSFALCDPITNPSLVTSQIKIGYNEDNPIIINESGRYLIKVQIDRGSIEQEFVVRQNHTGVSLDRTVYPVPWTIESPLKQIQHGIYGKDIVCREDRVLVLKKSSELYSCITIDTVPKLFARGWALNEVRVIDIHNVEQGKPIKITGVIDRRNAPEGFEYHLIPLREELPRIEYTGHHTLNLFSTEKTAHNFLRDLGGKLVEIEGKFLLEDGEYFRHFSGFPTIPVENMKIISDHEDLEYSINGAKVVSIIKIPDNMMLNIVIQDAKEGTLEITIPRDLMDTKVGEYDDDFFVLVDGEEVDFDEKRNDDERKLTIAFKENTTTIQVIGTFPI